MRPRSLLTVLPAVAISVTVYDDINPTDAFAVQIDSLALEKSVVDTATPTENVQIILPIKINVFDTATPAEVVAVPLTLRINVFDAATVTESGAFLSLALVHFWKVIVTISEPFTHVWDVVSSVTDIFITHQWNVIGVLSSITHSWRVLPSQIQTLFDNSIQLIVSVVDWSVQKIMAADNVPVVESVTLRGPSFGLAVSDTISVQESVKMSMTRAVSVADTATPFEDVRLIISAVILNVNDPVAVTENVTVVHS